MPNELPDPAKYHRLLRMVFSDLFALLSQLLRHGGQLRVKVCILHPDLVELPPCLVQLLPIRPLGYLLEDVSKSESSQCQAGPFCDVLKPVVLGLELFQFIVDALERVFRKVLAGRIHVPPRGLLAGFGFRMRVLRRKRRWRRDGSLETLRGGWSSLGMRPPG